MIKNWHTDFHQVLYEANFRAALTHYRYRVHYDRANRLWNLTETTTRLATP